MSFPVLDGHGAAVSVISGEALVSALKEFGAVILRNATGSRQDFIALTQRLAPGSERGVAPGDGGLEFHGEIYYTPWPPDVLWFYCLQPAEKDGQTLLCDGVELAKSMSPGAWAFFENNALVYEMGWPRDLWAPFFQTDSPEAVANHLKAWTSITVKFVDDTMRTRFSTSAIRQTKWGGATAFVNSLLHARDSTLQAEHGGYGLQTEIPTAILSELRDLTSRLSYPIEWKQGDIAMIDNTRVMHARKPFEGHREIIAVNGNALF
jgi:hypothetical protein